MDIVNDKNIIKQKTRALVITLEYNQFPKLKLNGCYNDGEFMIERFKKMDPNISITIMRDNMATNSEYYPTKENILREFKKLCSSNCSEDKLFFFYSGHGFHVYDRNKDERTIFRSPNGMLLAGILGNLEDSCFIANDIKGTSFILDDEISDILTTIPENKKMYAFVDSCNSGTIFDLHKVYLGQVLEFFVHREINHLYKELERKTNIIISDYPDKKDKVKADVILFSSCYDKQMSYKGYLNGRVCGIFTAVICWLLDNGGFNYSLKKFYLLLIGLINNPEQIPVITSSKEIDIDNFILTDLKYETKGGNNYATNFKQR
jgi:hypothetical protein